MKGSLFYVDSSEKVISQVSTYQPGTLKDFWIILKHACAMVTSLFRKKK
jgi:hypothetical protein